MSLEATSPDEWSHRPLHYSSPVFFRSPSCAILSRLNAIQRQLLAMISATTTQNAQIIKTPRKNLILGLAIISHVPASSPSTRQLADERAL
jgi:hypothetical protein